MTYLMYLYCYDRHIMKTIDEQVRYKVDQRDRRLGIAIVGI